MAIGDSYASVPELEQRLGRTDDGTFAALLDGASRAVESFTKRQFNQETTATPRRFRPVDWCRLPVDDFHTEIGLVVQVDDESTPRDSSTFDARPWDGIVDGQPGWAFFDLIAIDGNFWPYARRRAKVTVTAQWGWPAIPEGVKQSTLDVAVVMSHGISGDTAGPVRSEAIDGYSVSYQVWEFGAGMRVPPEMAKAAPYRRKIFGVA